MSEKTNPAEITADGQGELDPNRNADLVEQIDETVEKLVRDGTSRGDMKILARTLKELRYAFKVFSQYRDRRKVTVFGSARTQPDNPDIHSSHQLWPGDGRARLDGHHRRRQRHYGGGPSRRGA